MCGSPKSVWGDPIFNQTSRVMANRSPLSSLRPPGRPAPTTAAPAPSRAPPPTPPRRPRRRAPRRWRRPRAAERLPAFEMPGAPPGIPFAVPCCLGEDWMNGIGDPPHPAKNGRAERVCQSYGRVCVLFLRRANRCVSFWGGRPI